MERADVEQPSAARLSASNPLVAKAIVKQKSPRAKKSDVEYVSVTKKQAQRNKRNAMLARIQ